MDRWIRLLLFGLFFTLTATSGLAMAHPPSRSGDPKDLLQFVTTPMPDEERAPIILAIPMTIQEWQEEKAQEQWWSNLTDPRGGHYAAAMTLFSLTAINSLPHAMRSTYFSPHVQPALHSQITY